MSDQFIVTTPSGDVIEMSSTPSTPELVIVTAETSERIEIITPSTEVEVVEIHDGVEGPRGIPGPPGPKGNIQWTGPTDPTVVIGSSPGDTYLNTTTGKIWVLT